MNATAAAIYAHRHTVAYRLERVKELSGLDPMQTEDRERLGLGLKAYRIIAPRPAAVGRTTAECCSTCSTPPRAERSRPRTAGRRWSRRPPARRPRCSRSRHTTWWRPTCGSRGARAPRSRRPQRPDGTGRARVAGGALRARGGERRRRTRMVAGPRRRRGRRGARSRAASTPARRPGTPVAARPAHVSRTPAAAVSWCSAVAWRTGRSSASRSRRRSATAGSRACSWPPRWRPPLRPSRCSRRSPRRTPRRCARSRAPASPPSAPRCCSARGTRSCAVDVAYAAAGPRGRGRVARRVQRRVGACEQQLEADLVALGGGDAARARDLQAGRPQREEGAAEGVGDVGCGGRVSARKHEQELVAAHPVEQLEGRAGARGRARDRPPAPRRPRRGHARR